MVLPTTYFKTRDIVAIVLCAALWAVLNNTLAPIFWKLTHTPFICDFLAFATLILVAWWTRRFGAVSLTGILVAVLTLMFRPDATQMIGFTASSIIFDILTRLVGYSNSFDKPLPSTISLVLFSTICAGIAGLIIGSFFLEVKIALEVFAGMHAGGGLIGGIVGVVLVRALTVRVGKPSHL